MSKKDIKLHEWKPIIEITFIEEPGEIEPFGMADKISYEITAENEKIENEFFAEYDRVKGIIKVIYDDVLALPNNVPIDIRMEELRAKRDYLGMRKLLEALWWFLPDNKYNIKVNPAGWTEFLSLIEM